LIKYLKFWFPVILYSGIIFYVSSIPNISTPLPEVAFDKVLHIIEYVPFGYLLARGICGSNPAITQKMVWVLVFTICLLYGFSDEYHQSFVPGRSPSIIDLMADAIGGIFGGYFYLLVNHQGRKS